MLKKLGVLILTGLLILLSGINTGLASDLSGASNSGPPINGLTGTGSTGDKSSGPVIEVLADEHAVSIKVDGSPFKFTDRTPYISNQRTLVPLSFMSQVLGASIQYAEPAIMIADSGKGIRVQLITGVQVALVNGQQSPIEAAAELNGATVMVPLSFVSQALGAEVKYIRISKWLDQKGNIIWPDDYGFEGNPVKVLLQPGMLIDRYGSEYGTFVCPEGVPYEMRSLAPGSENKPYNIYRVLKPIEVMAGEIAPWFGQPGGGTQYMFDRSIFDLIEAGILIKAG